MTKRNLWEFLVLCLTLWQLIIHHADSQAPKNYSQKNNPTCTFTLYMNDFCGEGSLKIRGQYDRHFFSGCKNTVDGVFSQIDLPRGFCFGVIEHAYVGGYKEREHGNELLDFTLIPDKNIEIVLRLDSDPNASLPLVPVQGIHGDYENINYYKAYANTVVDWLKKAPDSYKVEYLILGNEVNFEKEQPSFLDIPWEEGKRNELTERVRSGEFGPDVRFWDGWGRPKIVQVITPERYAAFFKATAEALNREGFGHIKLMPAALWLDYRLYNAYLKAIEEIGAKRYVDAIPIHAYTNSLGFTPPNCSEPWCQNKDSNIQGELEWFLTEFLKNLSPSYRGYPIMITEYNPWIGWGYDPDDLDRTNYIRLTLNTIKAINQRGYRNKIIAWTPYSWNSDNDDKVNKIGFGLSRVPEIYINGTRSFLFP